MIDSSNRQPETATWRDVQASKPDPIAHALAAWHTAPDRSEEARMDDAIEAYEIALYECRKCDEPGCTKEGTYGFPVKGRYRNTCFEHSEFKNG